MELTYKVRGADSKEYGPVVLDELNAWLREGRLNAQTEIMRNDMSHWSAAGNFSELHGALPDVAQSPVAVATAPAPIAAPSDPSTAAQLKSGASWFYWIAGLSLINSFMALSGSDYGFILGLGITRIFDAFGMAVQSGGKVVALALDLIAVGIFVFFGVFANKRKSWAFVAGMALYGLDSLLPLLVKDWFSFGFHMFALLCLYRGLKACRDLNAA